MPTIRTPTAAADAGLPPARFLHRYVAWSLDASVLLALSFLPLQRVICNAATAAHTALVRLLDVLAAPLVDALLDARPLPDVANALLVDPASQAAVRALSGAIANATLPWLACYALSAIAWHAYFERAQSRASPGKRALHLIVIRADGTRLSGPRAAVRQLACSLSWLTLNLGHLLAALPPTYLSLHDQVTATRVVATDADRRLPRWAWVWLAMQAIALVCAMTWVLQTVDATLQVAIEHALQR